MEDHVKLDAQRARHAHVAQGVVRGLRGEGEVLQHLLAQDAWHLAPHEALVHFVEVGGLALRRHLHLRPRCRELRDDGRVKEEANKDL
jgi:hypothetical protein